MAKAHSEQPSQACTHARTHTRTQTHFVRETRTNSRTQCGHTARLSQRGTARRALVSNRLVRPMVQNKNVDVIMLGAFRNRIGTQKITHTHTRARALVEYHTVLYKQ